MIERILSKALPAPLRDTVFVRTWGFLQVPLIWACSPTVVQLDQRRCEVRIPLKRFTRNHLKSMYFGALAVGADVAGGLIAMKQIQEQGNRVSLVFKDFRAEFLKRPEGDVHFSCEQGEEVLALVQKAMASGERENLGVRITATVPKISGSEPVARFELTLSLKRKG
jgi:acyl-coenzyme A thioesterase PaaI-like protein